MKEETLQLTPHKYHVKRIIQEWYGQLNANKLDNPLPGLYNAELILSIAWPHASPSVLCPKCLFPHPGPGPACSNPVRSRASTPFFADGG